MYVKSFTFIIILLVAFGCGQSPKKISKNINEGYHLTSNCSTVNLYEDIALKENVLSLFNCIGYKKKYPKIYESLKSSSTQSFDVINQILQASFFKNIESRNQLFATIVNKTHKSSSKSLSHIGLKFLEKKENIESLKNILNAISEKNLKVSYDFLSNYLNFMANLNKDVEGARKKIGESFKELKDKKQFTQFLKVFFEDVLLKDNSAKENFNSFILDGGWLLEILHSINQSDFEDMIFFISKNPDFIDGIKTYEEAIETNRYSCKDQSGSYVVDHSVEYRWQIENLFYENFDNFSGELVSLITRFNLYNQICHEKSFIKSTSNLLKKFTEFLNIPGSFIILKNFARLSIENPKNTYILIDFFTSKSFKELERNLKSMMKDSRFSTAILSLLRSLSTENLQHIKNILNSLIKNEQFTSNFADIWTNKLSVKDKTILVDYVTEMFMTEEDIYPGFKFLNSVASHQSEATEAFVSELLGASGLEVLKDLAKELMTDEMLLDEIRIFLDENAIFKILSLLQKTDKEDLSDNDENLLSVKYERKELPDRKCIVGLTSISYDSSLKDLVDNFPDECLRNEQASENFSIKIIRWAKSMNESFEKSFGLNVVGKDAILNRDTMHFLHQMVHVTTKYVNSSFDFSRKTVNSVKDFFFKQKEILKLEQFLFDFIKSDKGSIRTTELLNKVTQTKPSLFDSLLKNSFGILSSYSESNQKYDCDKYSKFDIKCDLNLNRVLRVLSTNNINTSSIDDVLNLLEDSKYSVEDYIELIRFLGEPISIEVNDKKTLLPRSYKIEQILKAVDFSNNYYAIYFLSKLARTENYNSTVSKLKSDFSLVMKFTPVLRRVGVLPRDANIRFQKALKHLDILDDLKERVKSKSYSYGDVLVELSKSLNLASPKRSQRVRKVSIPNKNKVRGHLGHILAGMSKEGLLSHVSHYLYLNTDTQLKRVNKFSTIKSYFELTNELKLGNVELNLRTLPINKTLFKKLIELPNIQKIEMYKYLASLNLKNINLSLDPEKLDLEQFNLVFKIMSDMDVDYVSLHKSIKSVHSKDNSYFYNLIKYSSERLGDHTRIYSGLHQMFIQSNESLVNFFEDILAHFKIN